MLPGVRVERLGCLDLIRSHDVPGWPPWADTETARIVDVAIAARGPTVVRPALGAGGRAESYPRSTPTQRSLPRRSLLSTTSMQADRGPKLPSTGWRYAGSFATIGQHAELLPAVAVRRALAELRENDVRVGHDPRENAADFTAEEILDVGAGREQAVGDDLGVLGRRHRAVETRGGVGHARGGADVEPGPCRCRSHHVVAALARSPGSSGSAGCRAAHACS